MKRFSGFEGGAALWATLFIALLQLSEAAGSQVFVFNIRYEDGHARLIDSLVKEGFAPDYALDEGDASFELFDTNGNLLESFRFVLPLREFTDFSDENGTHGNVIIYTKRDFSIVAPYHPDAGGFRMTYNSKQLLYEDLKERLSFAGRGGFWILGMIGVIFIIVFMPGRACRPVIR